MKEATELFEGLGMQPAEHTSGAGEAVGAGIAEIGPLAERVGGDLTYLHDLVDTKPHHENPSC
jgi:hypothetical protein